MVQLIPRPYANYSIRLRVTRQIEGKRWIFDTVIPHANWEDLLEVNAPNGPKMSSIVAYNHARDFWDHLADQKADELMGGVSSASSDRQIEYVWLDFESLERAYTDFQQRS